MRDVSEIGLRGLGVSEEWEEEASGNACLPYLGRALEMWQHP